MRWSRFTSGAPRQHSEVLHSNHRNIFPRRPHHFLHTPHHHGSGQRPDWSEAQDTYICCAYSPRCFIIQKVKPSSQNSEDICEKELSSSTNITEEEDSTYPSEPSSPNGGSYVPQNNPSGIIQSSHFHRPAFPQRLNNLFSRERDSISRDITTSMDDVGTSVNSTSPEVADSNVGAESIETNQYQASPIQEVFSTYTEFPDNIEGENDKLWKPPTEYPDLTLKERVQKQVEYYLSRENLYKDTWLFSQMDNDGYVSIRVIAHFNKIRALTDDLNLVIEALKESAMVQVDDACERVRPIPRSSHLILREIPEATPSKDFEELFDGVNCPKFVKCEFAGCNDSWYVAFESDSDTQKAYQYLREETTKLHGKPVMVRIKTCAQITPPYTSSRNGVSNPQETETLNAQNIPPTPQAPLQYYHNIPNEQFNNQQVPFYPPTMLQTYAPTTPTCFDLGTVLSVNGLSPQAAFRPLSNSNRNFTSRDRPVKAYNPPNYFSRSEQNRFFNRNQSASFFQRQQLHQPASFPNIVNTNNCAFDCLPYASRSRNLPNFGVDMNFFTAPNLFYSTRPQLYPATHSAQAARHPVVVPRSQVGIGAIGGQDQSFVSVGNSASASFSRDSVTTSAPTGTSRQGGETQPKEVWVTANRQRNKRWWKENGAANSPRNFSENTNGTSNKSQTENDVKPDSPKFDLETTSFPPLPGSACLETVDVDVYESRLSDIVKGTVKPATRDTKTQTSESALVCTTKDSSTITVVDEAIIPSDGAFTPPASPEAAKEIAIVSDSLIVDNYQESEEWVKYADSPNNSTPSNTSIDINVVPEIQATFCASSNTPAFITVSTNSMVNGSVPVSDSVVSNSLLETEPISNVPSETVVESKQTSSVKLPKAKQLDLLPKNRSSCDTSSPKNKTPDTSTIKNKFDTFKERSAVMPKHSRTFSNSKNSESSSKEKINELHTDSKTDHCVCNKCTDVYPAKEKPVHGYSKRVLENSNKAKPVEVESSSSVNGHADSESTASSEDEKPFRKLTYSEVAMRAKDRVEKIAQEMKEKERQDAMVRQHKQQDVTQNRQPIPRGPPRELPRGRIVEARPGAKEWRERRKTARAISLPATGQ